MAVPRSSDARLYYRCAFQRLEEAELLRHHKYHTAAVYLAGYGVECLLKALILSSIPARAQPGVLRTFRGGQAHDFEWLRTRYATNGGAVFPSETNRQFSLVNIWTTNLRYMPRMLNAGEAEDFMNAAAGIIRWADGRM